MSHSLKSKSCRYATYRQLRSESGLSSGLEVGSDTGHSVFIDAEGVSEDIIIDGGSGVEQTRNDLLQSRILAVKPSEGQSGARTDIDLEVDEAAGEDEDVALVERGDEEGSVRGDETHVERALHHQEHLGGARVRVRHVDAAHSEVQTREPRAQSVEPRQRVHEHLRRSLPVAIVGVAWNVQPV